MRMLFRTLRTWFASSKKSSSDVINDIVMDHPTGALAPNVAVLSACESVRLAAQSGDLDGARGLMKRLAAENPSDPDVRLCEVHLLWFLGDRTLAHQKCVEELARRPADPGLMLLCAQFAQALGKHEEVIDLCSTAVELGVANPAVFCALASSFLETGSPQQAHDYFEKAVLADPDHAVSLQNLGYSKAAFGFLADAMRLLERAVELDPRLAEARMNLANVQRRCGRSAEAMQTIRAALGLDPENSRYLAEYASCLVEACQWDDLNDIRDRLHQSTQRELLAGTKPGVPPLLAVILGFTPELQLEIAKGFHTRVEQR